MSYYSDNHLNDLIDTRKSTLAAGSRGGAALELDALTCVRSGRTLFSAVSRPIHWGELLHVKGANGAGKTSLLRMLCGLMAPAQGQVLWRGQSISARREAFGRELVYLGHAAALKDDLSPLENLQAACLLAGQSVSTSDARRALDDAGLQGHHGIPARKLSQGQRRRSALARLVLPPARHAAPLWILDEPFNALDAAATDWLAQQVRSQLLRGGVVVLTSHQDLALDAEAQQVLEL
ncbi:cytochrome c biogenesis heme-transporting ATPase CcmA [soil metagenome]